MEFAVDKQTASLILLGKNLYFKGFFYSLLWITPWTI